MRILLICVRFQRLEDSQETATSELEDLIMAIYDAEDWTLFRPIINCGKLLVDKVEGNIGYTPRGYITINRGLFGGFLLNTLNFIIVLIQFKVPELLTISLTEQATNGINATNITTGQAL